MKKLFYLLKRQAKKEEHYEKNVICSCHDRHHYVSISCYDWKEKNWPIDVEFEVGYCTRHLSLWQKLMVIKDIIFYGLANTSDIVFTEREKIIELRDSLQKCLDMYDNAQKPIIRCCKECQHYGGMYLECERPELFDINSREIKIDEEREKWATEHPDVQTDCEHFKQIGEKCE